MSKKEPKTFKEFVQDPNWLEFEDFIFEEFDNITAVEDINTDTSSEAVHAEVIARARIKSIVKATRAKLAQLRQKAQEPVPTPFR